MARKKNNDDPAVSMDSLMDALTNVVAVLIVILILLQVDVTNTVQKLLDDLKPATPEQITAAQQKLTQIKQQIQKQQELLKAPEPTPQELGKIEADLSLLEDNLNKHKAGLLELDKLKQQVEAQKKTEAEERKKTDAILAEINRLKALLDQTPIPKAPQPTVVKIPNSRDIPETAEILYCYIHGDQAHFVDPAEAKKMVMAEFKSNERTLFRELRKIPKKADVRIYDQEKTVQLFAQRALKVRNQSLSVPYNKPWTRLNYRITFDPKKGDASLADMEQERGRFHNICNRVRSSPRNVLIFKVNPNGFATYIKAREIADSMNVACGWEIDASTSYQAPLDFEVNRLEQPPPPKPGAAPAKPAPKRKLD
jgi:hypothetical protein